MLQSTNLKLASTLSDQTDGEGFELTPERIEASFIEDPKTTQPTSNVNDHKLAAPKLNVNAHLPGVRWAPPQNASRLIGFVTEQRWQGYIVSVDGDGRFWGRVFDLNRPDSDEVEEAQFDSEDVPDLVMHLVKPGGIFFWDIGFQVEPSGQRVRQSILSFPMIPTITAKEVAAAKERAERRYSSLGWDRPQHDQPSGSENSAS